MAFEPIRYLLRDISKVQKKVSDVTKADKANKVTKEVPVATPIPMVSNWFYSTQNGVTTWNLLHVASAGFGALIVLLIVKNLLSNQNK